ncbi:MAG TPA: hypothetical protein VFC68_03360 [Treponemataceae bacterium]|nr:hypothetical protein [Treponemataceae bacterium]
MKKLVFFVVITQFLFIARAQSVSLIPPEVFVADTAEIRYTFSCVYPLCSLQAPLKLSGADFTTAAWKNEAIIALEALKNFDVLSAILIKNDDTDNYTFIVEIVPWITGALDIPPFDVVSVFKKADSSLTYPALIIDIPPVSIKSILTKTQKTTIQAPAGPLVIPGTTWIVYLVVIIVIILFFLLVLALLRFKHIQKWVLTIQHRLFLSKNYRRTVKKLMALQKNIFRSGPKFFAVEVSGEIRQYLQNRFGVHFTAIETSKLYSTLDEITAGTASKTALTAMEDLQAVCFRLDYIKFSRIDESVFEDDFKTMIESVCSSIAYFENREDDENAI